MKIVDILLYNNFPLQTELFIKTFTENNTYPEYKFNFIVVGTPDMESTINYDTLRIQDGSYKFSFLAKIDELIKLEHDFLIIADGRCMSLRPIKRVLDQLQSVSDWQICGDYVSPTFPLIFTSEYQIVNYFVFINFGFAILNPKNMFDNNVELAKEFIPSDMNLYIDRYALNMIYDKKIIETGLCIDRNAHCRYLSEKNDDIYNVVMDIYKTDTIAEMNLYDYADYFMSIYLDESSGQLRNEILRRRHTISADPVTLVRWHNNYILNKAVTLRNDSEFELTIVPEIDIGDTTI